MNELFIIQDAPILRDTSPLQSFLIEVNRIISSLFYLIAGADNNQSVVKHIMSDPLLMFPFGVVALLGTIGILKRILSRD